MDRLPNRTHAFILLAFGGRWRMPSFTGECNSYHHHAPQSPLHPEGVRYRVMSWHLSSMAFISWLQDARHKRPSLSHHQLQHEFALMIFEALIVLQFTKPFFALFFHTTDDEDDCHRTRTVPINTKLINPMTSVWTLKAISYYVDLINVASVQAHQSSSFYMVYQYTCYQYSSHRNGRTRDVASHHPSFADPKGLLPSLVFGHYDSRELIRVTINLIRFADQLLIIKAEKRRLCQPASCCKFILL
eukprot:scaffold3667_cov180-Amphora_coffeaeformis.AAC.13